MPKASRTPQRNQGVAIDVLINSAGIAGVPGQKTGNVDYGCAGHRRSSEERTTAGPPEGAESSLGQLTDIFFRAMGESWWRYNEVQLHIARCSSPSLSIR